MKKINFLVLCFYSLLLFSCSNLFDGISQNKNRVPENFTDKEYNVTLNLTIEGAIPSQFMETQAKSAVPSPSLYDQSQINKYIIKATELDASNEKIPGTEKSITATNLTSIKIKLGPANWLFEAEGVNSDGNSIVFGQSTPIIIDDSNINNQNPVSIKLKPSSTQGQGKVSVLIIIDSETDIHKVTVECEDNSELGQIFTKSDSSLTACTIQLISDSNQLIDAGAYSVILKFYKNISDLKPVYVCTEIINVFAGLTTNTWNLNSSCAYRSSDNKFKITNAVINPRTEYYINQNSTDSVNDGSGQHPMKSIQTAVDKILLTNNETKNYTIYLLGDYISDGSESGLSNELDEGMRGVIRIDGTSLSSALNLKIKSYTTPCCISGEANGRVFNIKKGSKNLNVTFENIKIDNGFSDSDGGALKNDGATLTLKDVVIGTENGNMAVDKGGGIYNTGSLSLENVTFNGNISDDDDKGHAIYSTSDIHVKGNLNFTEDNIITIENDKKIIVDGTITAGNGVDYSDKIPLYYIGAATGDDVITTNENEDYEKFLLKNEDYAIHPDTGILLATALELYDSSPTIPYTYTISTKAGMNKLSNWSSSNQFEGYTFKLKNNIHMNNNGTSDVWKGIGNNSSYKFSGTFDGDGYTIDGLVPSPGSQSKGLFINLSGTVKNLVVKGNFECSKNQTIAGGICATMHNGAEINNCISLIDIIITYSSGVQGCIIGGICGETKNDKGNTEIINCINLGKISSSYQANDRVNYISGIVGTASFNSTLNIFNCANLGNISFPENDGNYYLAGICVVQNDTSTTIDNCYNAGNITGKDTKIGQIVTLGAGAYRPGLTNCQYYSSDNSDKTIIGYIYGENPYIDIVLKQNSLENIKNNLNTIAGGQTSYQEWDKTIKINSIEYPSCVDVRENIVINTAGFGNKANSSDFAVGDIVFSDGTAESSSLVLSEEQINAAVGVIFAVDYNATNGSGQGDRKLMVGVHNSREETTKEIKFCNNNTIYYGSTSDISGAENADSINNADNANFPSNYPIYLWLDGYANNYVSGIKYATGWYIPAIQELEEIQNNISDINSALEQIGSDCKIVTGQPYWSSSQVKEESIPNHEKQVRTYRFEESGDGAASYGKKDMGHYVLVVREVE